jgi:hypothetical protein
MIVYSLVRNTTSASLPASRSIKYTASPCRLESAAFLTFSAGPNKKLPCPFESEE